MPFSFIHRAYNTIIELLPLSMPSIFTAHDRRPESVHPLVPDMERSQNVPSLYEDFNLPWVKLWVSAILADPVSQESVASRLQDLLARKSVNGIPSLPLTSQPKSVLGALVTWAQWHSKPGAIDAVWHAIFSIAEAQGWTEFIRDATYQYSMENLLKPPWDACSDLGDDEEDDSDDQYDNAWISCTFSEARLLALGYGYSILAWDALLDGLGLGCGCERDSDSMQIASCAQLLGAGTRLRVLLFGGGNAHRTPGPAGYPLDARPKSERAKRERNAVHFWGRIQDALVEEQSKAGPRAAALMQLTHDHLVSNMEDLNSIEVAKIIWPEISA